MSARGDTESVSDRSTLPSERKSATETVSGDLRAEKRVRQYPGELGSGNIRLVGIQSKDVRTETVSGDITYSGSIEPSGRYSFEHTRERSD